MAENSTAPLRVTPSIVVPAAPGWSLRATELDRTTSGEFEDAIAAWDPDEEGHEPRSYPGYPRVELVRPRARILASLDRALASRRSIRSVGPDLPSRRDLSRILLFSHGVLADQGRGPVPSAGGLQAVELFLVVLGRGWPGEGCYHYDRPGHYLGRVAGRASREAWAAMVPPLAFVPSAPLLWIAVGDGDRVHAKYGERGYRFLLLEAGHLAQNLSLMAASLGLTAVALGGCLESEIARELSLARGDVVLYAGALGRPAVRP